MKILSIDKILLATALLIGGCSSNDEPKKDGNNDNTGGGSEVTIEEARRDVKAPLYWSIYEYCWKIEQGQDHVNKMDFTESQWDEIINYVSTNLLPYGYDMLCTDGFISMTSDGTTPSMTDYGSMKLKKLVAKCKAKGLKLGVYDNPLWIHCGDGMPVPGTSVKVGDLRYRQGDKVCNPGTNDLWFGWIVASHNGAKEYIDGFFKYYSELGVDYIRMDFLSWYEDGNDRGMGKVGRGYGRDCYEKALQYIAAAANKYKVFTSLVMPHCFNGAELEAKYGNMFRVVADTGNGTWKHFSENGRGVSYGTWPNCNNMFDGFVYWSKVSGREKVILDGDFTRLNTFSGDSEKQSVITMQLMAGGPIAVADMPNTMGDNLKFYQNEELLALNKDGFVGQPLSPSLIDSKNRIWYGQMSNGDYVVAFFNRDAKQVSYNLNLSDIGISGKMKVRDLWQHNDEGEADALSVTLPAHACKVVRLSK